MSLYVGVDGGQTATQAVIGDERGVILGRGVGPPADLVGEARTSQRQAEAIDAAIADAMRAARLADDVVFAGVVCGISGYEEGEAVPRLAAHARYVRVVHDADIALVGALGGEPGIVVIAGTGSVALGIDERGVRVRVGGWGFLFGDEGSAFWIARRALTLAMRREDRSEASPLGDRALTFFGKSSLRALQLAFAHGDITRAALASFAPLVLGLACNGDVDAHLIRSDAARALADIVQCVEMRLGLQGSRRVSYVGGVFADGQLWQTWKVVLQKRAPHLIVRAPLAEPAAGALHLAAAVSC
jgi:N-acetylglucosamine kinase-like BadF-type ATPase